MSGSNAATDPAAAPAARTGLRALLPPALRGYRRGWLVRDVPAGITLAAIAIPEAMGYSFIAQVPISAGLAAMVLPAVIFALIGSSRLMVVGADSATAALIASGIAGLAIPGLTPFSDEWLGLAGLIAVVTGILLLLARLLRLGFLGDFLSTAVLVGFLAGVGLLVATAQLPELTGTPRAQLDDRNVLTQWWSWPTALDDADAWAVAFAVVTAVAILAPRLLRRPPPIPIPILVVIASIVVVIAAGLDDVPTVGEFGTGLPELGLPTAAWTDQFPLVLTISFGCVLVILAQSAATARSFARRGDRVDVNRDLVGLGGANLAAGFSGAFVVNGSPTKTAVLEQTRGRSQVANIVMAATVLLAWLLLAAPLAHLPSAVIAAIVFVVGLDLIDLRGFRKIWRIRKAEFVLAVVTAVIVVVFGVLTGIVVAMVLSLLQIIHRQYRPERFVVGVDEAGGRVYRSARPGHQTMPGLIVFRYDADLFYANVGRFGDDVRRLIDGAPDPLVRLVLDCSATSAVDYSAARELRHLIDYVHETGAQFVLAGVTPELAESLDTARIFADLPADQEYPTVGAAIKAYRREFGFGKDGSRATAGSDPGPVGVDDLRAEREQRDRDHLEARDAERDTDDGQTQREAGGDVPDREPDPGEDQPDDVPDR